VRDVVRDVISYVFKAATLGKSVQMIKSHLPT